MCPIWPLHLIIIYLLALCPLWVLCQSIPTLISFNPQNITSLNMGESYFVDLKINNYTNLIEGDEMTITSDNGHVATVDWNSTNKLTQEQVDNKNWSGRIRVDGKFLGKTDMKLRATVGGVKQNMSDASVLGPVIVVRPKRVIDDVFTYSVVVFISLIFINFGCAMDWPTVREVLRKPIGPVIGMIGQFLFMPLISFGFGYLIFPDMPIMHLGMLFTGVSPGGGASNVWTYVLGGNLNLSLAMSTISTLASFFFMPAWLFSLGQVVFNKVHIVVPYRRILMLVVGMIIPLPIGLALQKWAPKVAAFMVRILKGFSTALLMFIIIFAIVTNLYIFELFTWPIVIAGMCIPWMGYTSGYILARVFKQSHPDALAISIDTGIQNTGIAIYLLRYGLDPPDGDLTTVVPVAVAIMTPIPMIAIYICQKICRCVVSRNQHKKMSEEIASPTSDGQPCGIATIDVPN